jgi:hypothetical protein
LACLAILAQMKAPTHPKCDAGNRDVNAPLRLADAACIAFPGRKITTSGPARLAPLRMLTRQQAATYCGVSVPTFMLVCPISPVALGEGKRMERYDIRSLDRWLDKLGNCGASLNNDWLAKWDFEHDGRSR